MGENMTTFLTVLLASGIGSALVTAVFTLWEAFRRSELDYVQQQLTGLYGPLHYFIRQNQTLFDLHHKYLEAHKAEPKIQEYAPDKQDQARSEKRALIAAANAYVDEAIKNNQKIIDVLRNGWHLIDSCDVEVFSKFQTDYTRFLRAEEEPEAVKQITGEHLGAIAYMRGEMLETVQRKWEEKRNRIRTLSRFPSSRVKRAIL